MLVEKITSAPPSVKEMIGKTFNRLMVVEYTGTTKHGSHKIRCLCVCGKETETRSSRVKSGSTKSCGCFQSESRSTRATTHGCTAKGHTTQAYRAWRGMAWRCSGKSKNANDIAYHSKGIKVCDRWKVFANFLEDVGEPPSAEHSIDRFPNQDGNYEPGNVRWATRKEQCRNKTNNRMVTARGETRCIAEWAELLGVTSTMIIVRLRKGWSEEDAVMTPPITIGNPKRNRKTLSIGFKALEKQ